MDDAKLRITARFSLPWALKFGFVNEEYVARQEQFNLDEKAWVLEKELPGLGLKNSESEVTDVSSLERSGGTSGGDS